MTRPLALACLALAIPFFTGSSALAQIFYPPIFYPRYPGPPPTFHPPYDPVDSPVEVGIYGALGGGSSRSPRTKSAYIAGIAGVYGQWNRYGLCPGLDLRFQGDREYIHGYLVGPRVVYQPRGKMNPFRPYAEALFGKNETPYNTAIQTIPSITGTTRAVAIGLDLHSDSAFAWRVIEFTKGDFTGVPGSHPQSITTGIVLHLP